MTSINGFNGANHNVEDILASIRTSINAENSSSRMVSSSAQMQARSDQQHNQETSEFELPAIFKPGHTGQVEKPKLLNRLSDALKTAAPSEQPARSRTIIPFDPSVVGRMLEPPVQPVSDAANNGSGMKAAHASSLPEDGEPIARVMPTFFDTRLNRMGELTRKMSEPEPPPAPEPEPVPEPEPKPELAAQHPPHLPEAGYAQHATDNADDAAAQLLRPMLRQWLQENMPKIVEKALLSEIQGTPTKPRK